MHADLRAIRTVRAAAPRTPVKQIHGFPMPVKRASVHSVHKTIPRYENHMFTSVMFLPPRHVLSDRCTHRFASARHRGRE